MANCRFFHAEHTYPQTECDREFCYAVQGHPAKREPALPLVPDPTNCDHEWETSQAKLIIPGTVLVQGGKYLANASKVVLADRSFAVCSNCGAITYYHEQFGLITCHPKSYEAQDESKL